MQQRPDHYATLGINPTADDEVIAAAYRALAKKFHPDTGSQRGSASAERFRAVQEAWETLRDADRRRAYDTARLGAATSPGGSGEAPAEATALSGARTTVGGPPPPVSPISFRADREPPGPGRTGSLVPFAIAAAIVLGMGGGALWLVSEPLEAPAPVAVTEPAETQTASEAQGAGQKADPAATASTSPPAALPEKPKPAAVPVPRAKPRLASAPPAEVPEPPPDVPSAAADGADTGGDAQSPATSQTEARGPFALTMFEQRGGETLTLPGGRLTFNTRRACEAFGREARDRRLSARQAGGETPEVWFECGSLTGQAQD